MKGTFLLENLLGKLSFLNLAISPRAQLPVLSGFLFEAQKGKMKISATDLEIGIVTETPGSIDEEGRVVIPAKILIEFLATVTEEKITIEKKEKTLNVSGKKTKANLILLEDADFPSLFEEKGKTIIRIKKENAERELGRVVFAASQDSGRPAYAGVLLKKEKDGILMVATDSHRLSLGKAPLMKEADGGITDPILISAKTIKTALANKSDDDIEISISDKNNQVFFSQGETLVVGRLIDAEFPPFEKIIPESFSTKAEFDRVEMLSAIKSAAIFARDNANIIRLSVRRGFVSVWAKSQSLGENSVEVLAKTTGEENEIAFNARYLLELLQNIAEETILFEMTGPLNPGAFKIAGDNSFIHLIMPIRIKDSEIQV